MGSQPTHAKSSRHAFNTRRTRPEDEPKYLNTPQTPLFDVWVLLSYIAHATSTIRLATNVYVLPLRHPIEVARSVITLDRL